jgi:hypothetical protein
VCKLMEKIKKYMVILPISAVSVFVAIPEGADAQIVVSQVLSETVGRVIRAIDLEVQRLQNRTIWLQDAQKTLENQLSRLKLSEISSWSQKQKELFSGYYSELWTVKTAVAYYSRLTELSQKQLALVNSYHWAWGLLKADRHFSADELASMEKVYSGILQASVRDLDQLLAVVHAGRTQMPDAKRLELVNRTVDHMDGHLSDLQRFNAENQLLSIQRAADENEVLTLKRYYGIE